MLTREATPPSQGSCLFPDDFLWGWPCHQQHLRFHNQVTDLSSLQCASLPLLSSCRKQAPSPPPKKRGKQTQCPFKVFVRLLAFIFFKWGQGKTEIEISPFQSFYLLYSHPNRVGKGSYVCKVGSLGTQIIKIYSPCKTHTHKNPKQKPNTNFRSPSAFYELKYCRL